MAFCGKCGTQLPEGSNACPNCGAATNPNAQQNGAQQQNTQQGGFNAAVNNFTNTKNTTGEFDPADIQNNKIMAVLAYIGILFLVPLLAAKDSKFARFHANQGLVLFLADIIGGIIIAIVSAILVWIPVIGWLISLLISLLLSIMMLVFMIIGIVNAAQGQAKELPLIGSIKIVQ